MDVHGATWERMGVGERIEWGMKPAPQLWGPRTPPVVFRSLLALLMPRQITSGLVALDTSQEAAREFHSWPASLTHTSLTKIKLDYMPFWLVG